MWVFPGGPWLGRCTLNAGSMGLILVGELVILQPHGVAGKRNMKESLETRLEKEKEGFWNCWSAVWQFKWGWGIKPGSETDFQSMGGAFPHGTKNSPETSGILQCTKFCTNPLKKKRIICKGSVLQDCPYIPSITSTWPIGYNLEVLTLLSQV